MDSLFDEDIDEVGSEIEAHCPGPRCKADTHHTIVSMYEDEVRRVQCSVCGDVHPYRKARGEAAEDSSDSPSKRAARKPTWAEAMAQVTDQELARCRPYSIRDNYKEFDVVSHPTFDVGFVTELLPDNKVEVTFQDERRVLVHNRADLAEKMPGIADLPAPRPERKRKKRKKAKPPEEPTEIGVSDEAAIAEARVAKREAVVRAAEAKRKLTTQMAAERIKALRGSGASDEGDGADTTKAGRRRAKAAAGKSAGAKSPGKGASGAAGKSAGAKSPGKSASGAAAGKSAGAKSPGKSASGAAAGGARGIRAKAAQPSARGPAKQGGSRAGGEKRLAGATTKVAGAKKTVSAPAPIKRGAKKAALAPRAATAAKRPSAAKSGPAAKAKTSVAKPAKASARAARKR